MVMFQTLINQDIIKKIKLDLPKINQRDQNDNAGLMSI